MKDNGKDGVQEKIEVIHGKAPKSNGRPGKRGAIPKPPARAKQVHIPGMEPQTVPSIHKAIEEYVVARDQRMELTKVEVEKKARLMEVMKKAKVQHYSVDGHVADLDTEETIKARLEEPEGVFVERGKGRGAEARP
jgi:hypothetical protein